MADRRIVEPHLGASADPENRPRFMEVVRRRLREHRYSPRTQEAYVHWIRRFIRYHGRRHPKEMGEQDVSDFLSSLAVDEGVSVSTQKQATSALVFLYDRVLGRPLGNLVRVAVGRASNFVPLVLSLREMRALLTELPPIPRLCAESMYGSGLRISECVTLRVKDVDLDRLAIVVRGGKGGKDCNVPLAERCVEALGRHLRSELRRFDDTRAAGSGRRRSGWRWRGSIRARIGIGAGGMCSRRRGRTWMRLGASPPSYGSDGVAAGDSGGCTPCRAGEAGDVPGVAPFVRHAPARVWGGHSAGCRMCLATRMCGRRSATLTWRT